MITLKIFKKISIHPLFYLVMFICFLTGNFKKIMYFTLIIIVHELGHSITGVLLGFKLDKIEIYPYGGCSKLEYNINTPIKKELLILLMGPITQILFMYLIIIFKIDVPNYFYTYNKFILLFNLIPIYPLDGGRLFNLLSSYILSFYNSLKITIYLSYLIYISVISYLFFNKFNLTFTMIFILLGITLYKEIKRVDYIYNKYLLERYLYNFNFKKVKKIIKIKEMKKEYFHYFLTDKKIINEKEKISDIFG